MLHHAADVLRKVLKETSVRQGIRLLAIVVAKNAVGSSWRKTLGSREEESCSLEFITCCTTVHDRHTCATGEWSRIPAEEKAGVRSAALRLLFTEGAQRVAVQIALLITNIARS